MTTLHEAAAAAATFARRDQAQSLNAVKAALQNAITRHERSNFTEGRPFVDEEIGLRINDLKSVVEQVEALRTGPCCPTCSAQEHDPESELNSLRAWQLAVADGLGFVNRAEGQSGIDVAEPEVIVAYVKGLERDSNIDTVNELQARVAELEAVVKSCEFTLAESRAYGVAKGAEASAAKEHAEYVSSVLGAATTRLEQAEAELATERAANALQLTALQAQREAEILAHRETMRERDALREALAEEVINHSVCGHTCWLCGGSASEPSLINHMPKCALATPTGEKP